MANTEQNFSIWPYFTLIEPFIQCKICNVLYERNDIDIDTYYLKKHVERKHSYIIEEIKEKIKSTWLSQYFAFNVKREIIKCIFCKKEIEILDGVNLQHHMFFHNIHEHTINYLKNDITMQLNLPTEIYVKIIQKILDEISSAGLLLYFIFDTQRYGYTKIKCALCYCYFNIIDKQIILKNHLSLFHNISK